MLVCLMMHVLNHTPHTKKQTIELVVASHTTNTMPRTNYRFVGPQMVQLRMNMSYKALMLLWAWYYPCLPICPHQ